MVGRDRPLAAARVAAVPCAGLALASTADGDPSACVMATMEATPSSAATASIRFNGEQLGMKPAISKG